MLRALVCAVAALFTAACAVRSPIPQVEPIVQTAEGAQTARIEPVEEGVDKARLFTVRSLPPRSTVQSVEAADPQLAAALVRVSLASSGENHRAVAEEYMRLGIFDKADEYLSAALEIDPHDAAAWDRKARIWRDGGFPWAALPHATRAVHFAPDSAEIHNTLGTILQALGRHEEARAEYAKALSLDHALNTLCRSMVVGEAATAASCDLAYATGARLGRGKK